MVECFDRRDSPGKVRVMLSHVGLQLHLGIGGTSDQDCAGMREVSDYALEELLVDAHMATATRVCFVMQVLTGPAGMDHGPIGLGSADMEDSSFTVIDPDNCMVVVLHDVP